MNYWSTVSCRTLKGALARNGISYKRLSSLLEGVGERVSDNAIAHRVSRGSFSFEFFLKVAKVVGIEELDLTFLAKLTPRPERSRSPVPSARALYLRSQSEYPATSKCPAVLPGISIDAKAQEITSREDRVRKSPSRGLA